MDVLPQQPVFKTQVLDDVEGSAHFIRTQSRADEPADVFNSKSSFLKDLAQEISEINPELVQELDRIVKGKPEDELQPKQTQSSDIYDDRDYDTDLEIDDEELGDRSYLRREKHDTTGALHYVRHCQEVGVVPVQFFLRHHKRTQFVMRYHGLGSRGAQALCIPLEKNTYITKLNLEGNDVESEGAISLCKMLSENLYITELNLAENGITANGASCLCQLMVANNRISHLDLSGNHLTDHDAVLFGEMLQKNITLKRLYLSYNNFGDLSGQVFKDALSNNDTLQVLDLGWNLFRTTGAILISDGVKENVGLKLLNLRMNGFGAEGAKAMAHALMHNRTLMNLDLSSNRIPLAGAVALGKGINSNEILTDIKLGCNPLTAAGALCLLAAVSGNENSEIKFIDLSDVYVNLDFMDMKHRLIGERDIVIIHGSMEAEFKRTNKAAKKEYLKALLLKNPITKIKDFMTENGLRLIDFFKQLDKDNSNSLSYDELKRGCEKYNIELSDTDIMKTFKLLDTDKSGDIDFQELVVGNREHKILRRALLKEIAILEEEERKKLEEEKARKEAAGEDVDDLSFEGLSREEAWEAMEEVMKAFLETE
ncbi:leucine-rich repeat-containing protein 74A-like [Watersipora subatra]|uniref:leucine-rich repeat-containing protein 74A-like n=1 Tax=Watersipora subatra TaxID=2589382 RepID=UPI00355C63EA